MKIDIHAFYNCISLKEIDFSKCTKVEQTGIYNDNVPNDLSIIVPDKLYSQWCRVENPKITIIKHSDKVQQKIDNLKNSKILNAICHLEKAFEALKDNQFYFLNTIKKYLIQKYNIKKENIQYFEYLANKKEEIKAGKYYES